MHGYYDTTHGHLSSLLSVIIDNYESDRREYWGEDEDGNSYLQYIDDLTRALFKSIQDVPYPSVTTFIWKQFGDFLADEEVQPRVTERLEIEIGSIFCTSTSAMADRCLQLVRLLVISGKPNESVLRFMRRLSRCYIAGFFPESVIMCRAVFENALKDRYDRKDTPLPATPEGKSSMKTQIDGAKMFGWLSAQGAVDAWVVWKRGSKAAHEDPDATAEVLDTVRRTLGILRELYA